MEYKNERLEEFNRYLRNRKVAVIGLGVSNLPLLDYLKKQEAIVTVFDKRTADILPKEVLNKVSNNGMNSSLGENYLDNLVGFDIIFRSPSCRPDIPQIEAEIERGTILTSEIEMLMNTCPGTVIGVTGSDGKTTTTTLIYEILKQKGLNCYLGGNIGTPLFTKVEEMAPEDYVILELSSFQLMTMQVSPKIAVVTNVSPNHLDIHKSYEEYIEAKKNIFKYQQENNIVVLNYDNEITKEFAKEAPGKVRFFSRKTRLEDGVILDDGIIKLCEDRLRKHMLNTKDVKLRGVHNYENICAAIAATLGLVEEKEMVKAITSFAGVEHRLEFVREIDGAKWYNDSIASSPTRTIAGLNSFDENIVLIAGGYDKHLDYTPIAKPIIEHVGTLILMGQTAGKIFDAVKEELEKTKKTLNIYMCENMEDAVRLAKKYAKAGDVVMLSPASASFDLFKNFAERGEKFKELVNNM
ncbi:MAG: UDP-N-acetylmuramoyl-L-alanine--D-glutamate ligase [Clostridia bacterium]